MEGGGQGGELAVRFPVCVPDSGVPGQGLEGHAQLNQIEFHAWG